jgi:hypothetical protein
MNPSDYPGAENAVDLMEHLHRWGMYSRTAEIEGVETLIECLRESATTAMNSGGNPRKCEFLRVALAEWDHPNFTAYIIDKIKQFRSQQ